MSTKRVFLISAIFLGVLTVFRLIWLSLFAMPEHPTATEGTLDLRDWEPIHDNVIELEGEWEFFPNSFLMNEENTTEPTYVQVPHKDADFIDSSPYGYGSYRLRVFIDPTISETYGLQLRDVVSSSEVYINGQLHSQSGQPASEAQAYEPSMAPQTLFFTIDQADEIEIIIHYANFDNPTKNGIVQSIQFGSLEPFIQKHNFTTNIVILACIVYLLHAIYSLILYFVGKRDKRFIYFAFMILAVILATLFGERLIFTWLPFPFDWVVKWVHLTAIAGGYFLLKSIEALLPPTLKTRFVKPYLILCLIGVFVILSLPAKYNFMLLPFYGTIMLLPCLITLYLLFRATARINKDNIFLLLAAIAAIGSLIWFIVIEMMDITMVSYPFDLMITLTCFSAYWFRQYFVVLEQSQTMTKKLQRLDKTKDEFLITVAHEIRNPLHSIINISQSVLEKENRAIQTESAKNLNLITNVGRHLSTIVDEYLDLTRLKENRVKIHPENISIHTITEAVLDMVHFLTERKSIQLINEIPTHFPLVYADKTRITQVIFNLLDNAIKHSHASEIKVSASVHNNFAYISISDNGVGIEKKFLEKLFKPYEQANDSTLVNQGGFGLGLSISQQLIALHGGTLKAKTKEHEGTTFTFSLSLAHSAAKQEHVSSRNDVNNEEIVITEIEEESQPIEKRQLSDSNPIRILAVDDNPVNLKVLESMFSSEHEHITTVTSGKEALEMIEKKLWDLVIIDVMIPEMSGYELTRQIRQKYSISELPILIITARNQPEDIIAGYKAGANDYVTKPTERMELKVRIRTLTNLKQSISEQLRMEAAWLHAQIQPHFLFNTLNTIASLSEIDKNRMTKLLMEFSNYLRKSFDPKNSQRMIPLKHEIELIQSYLYIKKERFGERLNVKWDVDPSVMNTQIPSLTIQPLVENAIRHGILKRMEGGTIDIHIQKTHEHIIIAIRDNGVGMDSEKIQQVLSSKPEQLEGVGLYNTNKRLKQIYGVGLQIKSRINHGTTVSFTIPKTSDSRS